jgi:NAD(P)-dependent dehydrogenase (short-subunit alcohol dehydrogenase family)
MAEKRVAMITGVSSGIGWAAARCLGQRGFTVFGTARDPSPVEIISGVEILPLEPTAVAESALHGGQGCGQDLPDEASPSRKRYLKRP